MERVNVAVDRSIPCAAHDCCGCPGAVGARAALQGMKLFGFMWKYRGMRGSVLAMSC